MQLIIVLVVLISIVAADVSRSPLRLAVWSNDNKKLALEYNTKTTDMDHALTAIEDRSKRANILALFTTTDGRPAFLHTSISKSVTASGDASVMPHVYHSPSSEKMPAAEFIRQSMLMKNSQKMTLAQFRDHLHSSNFVRGHQAAPIEVTLTGHETEAQHMEEINELLKGHEAPQVLFTAIEEQNSNLVAPLPIALGAYSRLLATTSTSNLYYLPEGSEYSIYYADTYLYITPDIFTGLMTFLFMTFVLLTGFTCLNHVQGPSTFVLKGIPIGREA